MKIPDGKQYKHIILVSEVEGEDIRVVDTKTDKSKNWSWHRESGHSNMFGIDNDMTRLTVTTFNTRTMAYADNSVYRNSKGDYIKKDGKRFYLKEFK